MIVPIRLAVLYVSNIRNDLTTDAEFTAPANSLPELFVFANIIFYLSVYNNEKYVLSYHLIHTFNNPIFANIMPFNRRYGSIICNDAIISIIFKEHISV